MKMRHEFQAILNLVKVLSRGEILKRNDTENYNKTLIDALSNRHNTKLPPEWNIPDLYARIQILAQTLASDRRVIWRDGRGRRRETGVKEYARTGALQYNMPSGLFWLYHAGDPQNPLGIYQHFLRRRLRWMNEILQYECPSFPDPSLFPDGSWTIKTFFVLRKPYISKDDTTFYLIDNPVKKEWVFKVPYVAPSQWKGALRSAMVRKLVERLA
ncbi:MAG: hypothetical protein C6I01_05625, partial [Epsilonproteobacteria bacterium]|nr:hypothetical protein [Campylobacterota bacterium]